MTFSRAAEPELLSDSRHVWLAPHRSTAQVINMKTLKPLQVTKNTLCLAFMQKVFPCSSLKLWYFDHNNGQRQNTFTTLYMGTIHLSQIVFHKSCLLLKETLGCDFSHNSHNPLHVYKLIHTMSAVKMHFLFLMLHCCYFTLISLVTCSNMQFV